MAQVVAVLAKALWLTIDRDRIMTHAEAADNMDGLFPEGDEYGPCNGCERWDLQYLGTPESPSWTPTTTAQALGVQRAAGEGYLVSKSNAGDAG